MKIKVGDLLMSSGKIGMVEGIGYLASGTIQYWVYWSGDNWEHWISEASTIIYRDVYLRYLGSNALLD